ncbi:MAG: YopX family protein [Lutibacter sp.]|jgi:hypothetical protein
MRLLKFKAWDKKYKRWCSSMPFNLIGEWTVFDCLNEYIKNDFVDRLNDIEVVQFTGLKENKEKKNKEIYFNSDIVKFKFNDPYNDCINLIGIFNFNDKEMRTEIDIFNNDDYICLWYVNDRMFDFEIIGTKQKNPELLEEIK